MKTVAKPIIGVRFMVISSQDAEDSSQDAENSWQDAEDSSQDAENSSQDAENSSQDAENSWQDAEDSSQDAENSSQDALYVHASVHMSCNYIYFCTGLNVKVLPSLVRHMVW